MANHTWSKLCCCRCYFFTSFCLYYSSTSYSSSSSAFNHRPYEFFIFTLVQFQGNKSKLGKEIKKERKPKKKKLWNESKLVMCVYEYVKLFSYCCCCSCCFWIAANDKSMHQHQVTKNAKNDLMLNIQHCCDAIRKRKNEKKKKQQNKIEGKYNRIKGNRKMCPKI